MPIDPVTFEFSHIYWAVVVVNRDYKTTMNNLPRLFLLMGIFEFLLVKTKIIFVAMRWEIAMEF